MSLRSLAAYTRVSRGPASKKTLLESLNVLGLTPSTTTSVSSSFSKLTEGNVCICISENTSHFGKTALYCKTNTNTFWRFTILGDTKALCEDMKDFAHDYIDYGSMAKQLIPETNTVQHWSKVIETKYVLLLHIESWLKLVFLYWKKQHDAFYLLRNHLEDMRKCFKDPVNSNAFDNVTHGLGLGMLDVALDTIIMVIEQQIRILSGAAASDPADTGTPMRRIRRRHRNTLANDAQKSHKVSGDAKDQGKIMSKAKGRSRAKKKVRQEVGAAGQVETQAEQCHHGGMEQNVLMVSVGYETVPSGLNAAETVWHVSILKNYLKLLHCWWHKTLGLDVAIRCRRLVWMAWNQEQKRGEKQHLRPPCGAVSTWDQVIPLL